MVLRDKGITDNFTLLLKTKSCEKNPRPCVYIVQQHLAMICFYFLISFFQKVIQAGFNCHRYTGLMILYILCFGAVIINILC